MRYQANASVAASELVIRADLSPKSLLTLLNGNGSSRGLIVYLIEMLIRNCGKSSKHGRKAAHLTLKQLKESVTHTPRRK
jgi:hypothetical protein